MIKATNESLTADLGETDVTSYISKQYQHYLGELRRAAICTTQD